MANFWTKIYNLYRQPTRRTNLTYDRYLPYFDGNDNFALKWHQAISESPSATACVSTIQDFLEGFGFSDPDLEKRVVNSRGETFFQIHQKTCKDFGEFEGFYWHFMYNGMGQITEWTLLPFENCRLGKPDDQGYISKILYNPYFGTSDFQISKDTTSYDVYNPKAVKEQIAKAQPKDGSQNTYKGQVFFFGTTNALSRFYPMPEAHSAIKWMGTEKGVADYHEDNINNGFLQPFMLAVIGNPNEPVNNPEDSDNKKPKTMAEALDDEISRNFMGAKRVGNMWVQWFSNKEEIPVPVAFPSNNNGDLFNQIDNQATKKITIAFKVPGILANINEGVSLGGDGNTMRVAVKLMQQRVIKKQRILTDCYQKILRAFSSPYVQEIFISPYNPYPELEVIDDKIWAEMSKEDRKDWIEKNTEIELLEAETEAPVVPLAPAARISNVLPVPFPDKVRDNAKRALEYQDKMSIKCMGPGSRELAEAIRDNKNLGLKALKRIHGYLKKRPEIANKPFNEGCSVIEYQAWGGKEMEEFLELKLKELEAWLN